MSATLVPVGLNFSFGRIQMPITLSVQTYRDAAPPAPLAARFDQLGGAIGRAVGNELVLDDPSKYISRVHARIEYRDGGYCIVDVGSNPSLVNERPVGQGRQVALADGDRLRIGDYLLSAALVSDTAAALPLSPLQSTPPRPAPPPMPFDPNDSLASASILDVGGDLSNPGFDSLGLDLFGSADPFADSAAPAPATPAYRGAEFDHLSPEAAPFQMPFSAPAASTAPPSVPMNAPAFPSPAGAMAIPDDYDPLADFLPPCVVQPAAPPPVAPPMAAAPAPAARPVPPAAPAPVAAPLAYAAPAGGSAADNPVIQAFMRGMGLPELNNKKSAEEVAEMAGAMLREATRGTMGVLMARAMTKKESRLDMTMISSQANNPLKFFPDPDSALLQMMNASMPGYMTPVKAFSNAFDDLKAHELAMVAGMRAALNGVLKRFDPAAVEHRMQEPSVMDKMMAANRKAKMWDNMVELYQQLTLEADDDFQRLFGDAFSQAYEEQIRRLQQHRF